MYSVDYTDRSTAAALHYNNENTCEVLPTLQDGNTFIKNNIKLKAYGLEIMVSSEWE
jgi:hypothetical protein